MSYRYKFFFVWLDSQVWDEGPECSIVLYSEKMLTDFEDLKKLFYVNYSAKYVRIVRGWRILPAADNEGRAPSPVLF